MFKQSASDDIPATVEMSESDFLTYRGDWHLWRALGSTDSNGSFVAPVSFLEAMQLPKRMIDTFLELDSFFERMRRQREKKRRGK